MPVNVAIVGPAGSGKSTLFRALTAGRGAGWRRMVDVPDERLQRLADAVKPLKVTPAQVRVETRRPGAGRSVSRLRARRMCWSRSRVASDQTAARRGAGRICARPGPRRPRVGGAAPGAGREGGACWKEGCRGENDVLQLAKAHLDAGQPLRTLPLEREQGELLKNVFPVTLKPTVFVANSADELLPVGGDPAAKVGESPRTNTRR